MINALRLSAQLLAAVDCRALMNDATSVRDHESET
ncbi:hypothetical protein NORO109296_05805 [Nocardiopsis rhodophaea]